MKTLVIGASTKPDRYSYNAVKRLLGAGNEVVAIGSQSGKIEGVTIETEKKVFRDIDTVSLYVNPMIQESYYDYITNLEPRRVIFNPGTENPEFLGMLERQGIIAEEACTLVLLSTGQY